MSNKTSDKKNTLAVIALITASLSLLTAALPYVRPYIQPLQDRRARSILLSYMPAKVRTTCTTDTSDDFRDAVVSIECDAKGVTIVRVGLYRDSKSLYAHYRETVRKAHLEYRDGKGCERGESSERSYVEADTNTALGRFACWIDDPDKVSRMEWTVSDINAQAYAFFTGDLKSLYKWWEGFYIQRDNPT